MESDHVILLLIFGTTFLGGLITLSLCAGHVQMQKLQMKLQREEERKRKQRTMPDPNVVEAS